MELRRYVDGDAEATLAVFRRAVHETASRDYSPEQVAAWAPEDIELEGWAARRASATTWVATEGERVIGFADLVKAGHVDMTFVDPDVGGRGVATALLATVAEAALDRGIRRLTVHASLTALPFFERHGFVVDEQRAVERDGVLLTSFAMSRELAPADPAPPRAVQEN